MQELEKINVGQQANDGTGDPLRNGMQTVNANFTKVQAGVDAVESMAANAEATAVAAKAKADGDIPATEKGMAGGVAPLDASGKVPAAHLPVQADYIPAEEKGAAGGVAPLDSSGKVPAVNLPAAQDSIPLTQKGVAGGVATLDGSGQVPGAQLGGAVKSTEKGAASGVATLDAGGKVPTTQLPPIPSGPPVASIAWWPLRTSIPAGQIPADGQAVSRATFPDLAAMVTGGKVPVVTEADWLADPLKRGAYTLGDGSTTIRMPDLNGQSSGSIGAVFQRGDGALASGTNGLIQRDALQNITGRVLYSVMPGAMAAGEGALQISHGGVGVYGSGASGSSYSFNFDASRVARTAGETRPLSVSGVWTIQAFGAVTNPGSVDAAQLASDYARLNASLQNDFSFAVLYPGGTSSAPGVLTANTQVVVDNPFPGFAIMVIAEHRVPTDFWADPGWYSAVYAGSTGESAWGIRAHHILSTDKIIVQSGKNGTATLGSISGSALGNVSNQTNAYYRLKVWKLKGKIT